MKAHLIATTILATLFTAGCAWLGVVQTHHGEEQPLVAAQPGTRALERQLRLAPDAVIDYRLYLPPERTGAEDADSTPPVVILAHGFLRDRRRMAGLATALANAGYPVATPNFRHGSAFSGGHVANSQDLIQLARHLAADMDTGQVIYAGFSAGALAALLAARADPAAIGLLTLDLVDSRALGSEAAEGLQLPVVALAGAPSNCNAQDNAAPIYARLRHLHLTRFAEASHCDFESPSDWLCRSLCDQPETAPADTVQPRILHAAVSGVDALRLQSLALPR